MVARIRNSDDADVDAIDALINNAFGETEGVVVAGLVNALLRDSTAEPRLSLVADVDDSLAGHILFSRAWVTAGQADDTRQVEARILSPLAVARRYQRQGIGASLVREGLHRLQQEGVGLVFVYGSPDYYQQHGFIGARERGLDPPFALPARYENGWMVRETGPGSLKATRGVVNCANSLSKPGYWQ